MPKWMITLDEQLERCYWTVVSLSGRPLRGRPR